MSMVKENKGIFCLDTTIDTTLEDIFEQNKGLVYHFANNNKVFFLEREEYIQLLLIEYWDLIQKFDWDRYDNQEEIQRAFCGYVKTSLTRYLYSLTANYYKNAKTMSLDCITNDGNEVCFIDLEVDKRTEGDFFDKNYYLYSLKRLHEEGKIQGYLIDYIETGSYSEVARIRNCSRGKARDEIHWELDELRKVI